MRYLRSTILGLATASLALLGVVNQAQAGKVYDIYQQTTGFVSGLSGASDFGLSDGTGPICPLCDSTVNFATYANPGMGDWTAALGVNPTGVMNPSPGVTNPAPGFDPNAKWVFFYQVRNTNPLEQLGIEASAAR